MKRALRRLTAVAIVLAAAAPILSAEEKPAAITGTASLTALNRYIFRGYRFGGGGLVVQPYLTASFAGFSASIWGNFDAKEAATPNFAPAREGRSSYNETDISGSYAFETGPFALSFGFVYYGTTYAADTIEIFATAAWRVFGKPTLSVYQDVSAYPGTYLNFSWMPSFALAEGVSLDLCASLGYERGGKAYWRTFDPSTGGFSGSPYRAYHDGMLKAGLTIALGPGLSLQPQAQYAFPISAASRRAATEAGGTANGPLAPVWVFGAALQFTF
jgi:hypothetical protein